MGAKFLIGLYPTVQFSSVLLINRHIRKLEKEIEKCSFPVSVPGSQNRINALCSFSSSLVNIHVQSILP